MAKSPAQSTQPPIQQLQTIANLLDTPALARIYAYILQEGPVSVPDIVADLDFPQGTAYDYMQKLEAAEFVVKTQTQRPYNYDADPISLTLTTGGETRTITSALIASVARRAENDDINMYIDRHGIDGLAIALDYAQEYVEGAVNHRIAARELDLSPLEAEIILQALEPIAREYATE